MEKKAIAVWEGSFDAGIGAASTQSGVLSRAAYDFNSRFGAKLYGPNMTSPEELLAAAHAQSYAMQLAAECVDSGMTPHRIEVTCTYLLEQNKDRWEITSVDLAVRARVELGDPEVFEKVLNAAKKRDIVSDLIKAKINVSGNMVIGA